ncbi:MAG: ferrochelatase [Rhodothermales bacterium]
MSTTTYDAILILSFGGPEGPDDVMPFLDNVLRGRRVPEARKLEVAEHYELFGGVSPINAINRELAEKLQAELAGAGHELPVYLGNRNWHPMLADTLREMRDVGVRRALTFVTSAFSSYSGCRQYKEDVARAREEVGEGAPELDKLRLFFNHPRFIAANSTNLAETFEALHDEPEHVPLLFTAHSIPNSMAASSQYVEQLLEACQLLANAVGNRNWKLVYQSRSGPPHQPWLEPDILDHIKDLHEDGATNLVVHPVGFLCDHLEVLYDLDHEAAETCYALGIHMLRVPTPGCHPEMITMARDLIEERLLGTAPASAGSLPPWPNTCPPNCCQTPS